MSVLLQAIKFNHDRTSATSDALTIRRNAFEEIPIPEWVVGRSSRPQDSPVAYAIRETRGSTLTIEASFARTTPDVHEVEVRAVAPPMPVFPAWYLEQLLRPLRIWPAYYFTVWHYLVQLVLPAARTLLGEVHPRRITFERNGESGFQPFALDGVRYGIDGIGARDVHWLWQYREDALDAWTDFALSSHRVYVVLEVPKEPWSQRPANAANTQLPWVEVLEVACEWAQRAASLEEAAGWITRAVNDLGRRPGPEYGERVLEYGCEVLGVTAYSFPYFQCTRFLERLRGGAGLGAFVNCSDCATIVATFANALGCDLWQSRMGVEPIGFGLNPILAIGKEAWGRGCGWGGFTYHEVAWTGACGEQDDVYDACLQVNGRSNPTTWPYLPLLPVHMRFGEAGDGRYRDRLAAPGQRAACEPQPYTRQRRFVV